MPTSAPIRTSPCPAETGSSQVEAERQFSAVALGPVEDWIRRQAPGYGFSIDEQGTRLSPHALFILGRMEERYRQQARHCLDRFPRLFRGFRKSDG